ncbi:hypothetical protein SAMN05428981_103261 [Bacillus sp. OV194]|nr:hypothetical protein SAMN05428981_103261 [Bacillus sp. OV194]
MKNSTLWFLLLGIGFLAGIIYWVWVFAAN